MAKLHWDTETRGIINLKKVGSYRYFEHWATQFILSAFAIDDGPVQVWDMLREPVPKLFREAALDPSVTFCAHNVQFERSGCAIMGARTNVIPADVRAALRPRDRWNCTAARAAAVGLPRALENAAKALHLPVNKDLEGYKLMMQMCVPRAIDINGRPLWREHPGQIQRLGEYCVVDVETERALDHVLPELSDFERRTWLLTEAMNDRGVRVDDEFVVRAMLMIEEAEADLNTKISAYTDGAVPKITSVKKLKAWLETQGLEIDADDGIGKFAIRGWLEDDSLPDWIRDVLVFRQEGGKTSAGKYRAILERMNADKHVRGALLYCGAAATKRYSSRGVQLQNLPRGGTVKHLEAALECVMGQMPITIIRDAFGPPLVVASELLRPTFMAPDGYWLARGDYSQIEARILPWLAGEDDKLVLFKNFDTIVGHQENGDPIRKGPDNYKVTAAGILSLLRGRTIAPEEVTKEERQSYGKVPELACGYGGSVGAFQSMARVYAVNVSDTQADEIKTAWRVKNANIKQFWSDLETAAMECMRAPPGERFYAGKHISFRRNNKCLGMRLPSGGTLMFWYPRIEKRLMPWVDRDGNPVYRDAITFMGEDSQKHIWHRFAIYGGLLSAMATQGTARDVMCYALLALDDAGLIPIMTVHDEGLCLAKKAIYQTSKLAADAVEKIMLKMPPWLAGCPISADASAHERYLKAD
jgi:DNA polymerase